MSKRWLGAVVAVFAVLTVAGVGFSAFTATVTVNGSATAASMGLVIAATDTYTCNPATLGCSYFLAQAEVGPLTPCDYFYNVPGAPGNTTFTSLNPSHTSVTLATSNLTPSVYCAVGLVLENTGSVPVNVSVALSTPGSNGLCVAHQLDCYGVFTLSGVGSDGTIFWVGAPNYGTPTYSSSNFATLNPGGTYIDLIGVDLPTGSDNGTPATGTFTLVYTASAGE